MTIETSSDLPQRRSGLSVGIFEVAHAANVSTATVSRALRGLPRVSPETRKRVLAAASRLGYVASPTASGLATGQTRMVGVLTVSPDELFDWRVLRSVARELSRRGYGLVLFDLNDFDGDLEALLRKNNVENRCDGILILGADPGDERMENLCLDRIPSFSIDTGTAASPSAGTDESSGTSQAVDQLVTRMTAAYGRWDVRNTSSPHAQNDCEAPWIKPAAGRGD